MSMIGLTLPLILVFFMIFFVVRASSSGNKKFFQGRMLKRLLVGYFIILLASPLVFYFLQFEEGRIEEDEDANLAIDAQDRFYESLYDEGKADFEGMELREELEFDYEDSTLNITPTDDQFYLTVIAQKKESLDEKIKGSVYVSPTIVNEVEFKSIVPSLQVDLSGDTIVLGYQEEFMEIHMAMFSKEFAITQFTEGSLLSEGSGGYMSILGDSYLYLQIPEDLTLVSENENIHIIYLEE